MLGDKDLLVFVRGVIIFFEVEFIFVIFFVNFLVREGGMSFFYGSCLNGFGFSCESGVV